jgi:3-oxoacyl-[acyl-carrier-protein] synthase III
MPTVRVGILGLGSYLPSKILNNHDLEKMVDTSDEWITTRTGIKQRRIAEKGTPTSDLAAKACEIALKQSGLNASEMDLIICATISPDMFFPSTACVVQRKIGAKCPAFDISAACSGFPYALGIAESFIRAEIYKNVLVIGAEVISTFINWKDRSTCVLFGDGAGAAVVGPQRKNGNALVATFLGSDGNQADLLKIPAGGSAIPTTPESIEAGLHYVQMEGSEVFKCAVKTMVEAIREVLKRTGRKVEDIDCLIPHQANLRILNAVAERVNLPEEKMFINLDRYGNMSAASTVVALEEAHREGRIKPGSFVVLVAFGSGFTWAANAIEW